MGIEGNLEMVKRIEKAAAASGRKPEDIKLVAVTKTLPPKKWEAATLGMTCGREQGTGNTGQVPEA